MSGTLAGGAPVDDVARMERFGGELGLLFQVRDDLLDVEGETDALGKSVGSDQRKEKVGEDYDEEGQLHLAAAVGVKTIGIFGSTDPGRTAPRGAQARWITKALDCAPCMERTCRFESYDCLRAITPDDVFGEIMR